MRKPALILAAVVVVGMLTPTVAAQASPRPAPAAALRATPAASSRPAPAASPLATPANHGRPHFTPGSAGSGDPYFPDMGNGGYDVSHYDINLAFDPTTHAIAATTRIDARATQDLSRFDLDFLGPLTISKLTIDGRSASFTRSGAQAKRRAASRCAGSAQASRVGREIFSGEEPVAPRLSPATWSGKDRLYRAGTDRPGIDVAGAFILILACGSGVGVSHGPPA